MSNSAIALPVGNLRLWIARARGLFRGLGYAVTLVLCMTVGWLLQAALPGAAPPPTEPGYLAATLVVIATATLPSLLAMVAAVNLAPPAGAARPVWLLGAGVLTALWAQTVVGRGMPPQMWLACLAEAVLWTSLVVIVCACHSHRQGASDRLLRTQIERATLDAELKRAHLQLLRAQIEPHFLFNTLSAVRSLSRTDRAATVEMLDNLMRYFTAALPQLRQEEAPLAEEMRLIDSYLGIYRVRMGGARLAYQVTLPKNLANVRVPTMMLLTLVENALKHGVGPVVEGGFIRVSASRERSALLLKVADSGRGLDTRLGHGVGLANVRQRLLMLYGNGAVLSLAHAEPRGVVATLSLPVH
ncbi:MAG TPA: histidine kinase [Steroidobacteraceae bacterium]